MHGACGEHSRGALRLQGHGMVFTLMRTFDWFITAASRQDSLFTYGRCSNAVPENSYLHPGSFCLSILNPFFSLHRSVCGLAGIPRPALSKALEAVGGKGLGWVCSDLVATAQRGQSNDPAGACRP